MSEEESGDFEGPFTLVLTLGGGAQLEDADGELVWSSDDDEDYPEHFPDFLQEQDVGQLLSYLVEIDLLDEDEADEADIEVESING